MLFPLPVTAGLSGAVVDALPLGLGGSAGAGVAGCTMAGGLGWEVLYTG
jgi:hypothetical protein